MVCTSGINVAAATYDVKVTRMVLRLLGQPECGYICEATESCSTTCACTLTQGGTALYKVIAEVEIQNNTPLDITAAKISLNLHRDGAFVQNILMESGNQYETTRCLGYGGDKTIITSDPFYLPSTIGTYTVVVNSLEALPCVF